MQGRTSSPGWWLCCSAQTKCIQKMYNSSSITFQQQTGSPSFSACGLMDVPQVSPSVFVFMANHKIVAPDCKPGHLKRGFLLSCQALKITFRQMSGCVNAHLLGCWDTSPQVCARGKTTLWVENTEKRTKWRAMKQGSNEAPQWKANNQKPEAQMASATYRLTFQAPPGFLCGLVSS